MVRRVPRRSESDGFRFHAGRPSLDLCATLLWRHVEPTESLRAPADLSRWLREAGLCGSECGAGEADLLLARELREDLYRLFRALLAGRRLPAPSVEAVNALAARPPRRPELRAGGRVTWLAEEPIAAALSTVARDGIDLLAGPLRSRVHECAAPDCAFLFVDTSRAGRRRWCATNRCGNRQHVRDHRARQRRSAAHQARAVGVER